MPSLVDRLRSAAREASGAKRAIILIALVLVLGFLGALWFFGPAETYGFLLRECNALLKASFPSWLWGPLVILGTLCFAALVVIFVWILQVARDMKGVSRSLVAAGERFGDVRRDIATLKTGNDNWATMVITRLDAAKPERYPRFQVLLNRVTVNDASEGKPLFAAIMVTVLNYGAPSVVRNVRVVAKTAFGTDAKPRVFYHPTFPVVYDNGTKQIDYAENHYLYVRTRDTMIERGHPVSGIVPVVFDGVADQKELDYGSIKVEVCDGTGDDMERDKWWSSERATQISQSDPGDPLDFKPGFPMPYLREPGA